MILALTGAVFAQNDDNVDLVEKTTYTFENTNNHFLVKVVGEVVVLNSPDEDIHCDVKIVTSGQNTNIASVNNNPIKINAKCGDSKHTPELAVNVKNGLHQYNITTTVYLPQGVILEHKENFNFTQLLQKLWNKIIQKE